MSLFFLTVTFTEGVDNYRIIHADTMIEAMRKQRGDEPESHIVVIRRLS